MRWLTVDPNWSFREVLAASWGEFVGYGIESRGRRNRILLEWAERVGRERATRELETFIQEHGGIEQAASEIGVASSGAKRLRSAFMKMPERRLALSVGERLQGHRDSYDVGTEIGSGGMGRVYEVTSSSGGRYAAKILTGERFAITDEVKARFEREIELASSFDHPNLVRAVDVAGHERGIVCIMELMEGPTLQERVRQEVPGAPLAVRWMRDLAAGLKELHERGIVHRDLSARNAMLRADDSVALCDFGVARRIDDPTLTHAHERMGSLIYIAPEQRENPHGATFASDVFALGQVFFFIATGVAPHGNPGTAREASATCHSVLSDLVESIRRHRPAERPKNGADVAALVERARKAIDADPEDARGAALDLIAKVNAAPLASTEHRAHVLNESGMGSYMTVLTTEHGMRLTRRVELLPQIFVTEFYFKKDELSVVRASATDGDGKVLQSTRFYRAGTLIHSEGHETDTARWRMDDDVSLGRALKSFVDSPALYHGDSLTLPSGIW